MLAANQRVPQLQHPHAPRAWVRNMVHRRACQRGLWSAQRAQLHGRHAQAPQHICAPGSLQQHPKARRGGGSVPVNALVSCCFPRLPRPLSVLYCLVCLLPTTCLGLACKSKALQRNCLAKSVLSPGFIRTVARPGLKEAQRVYTCMERKLPRKSQPVFYDDIKVAM